MQLTSPLLGAVPHLQITDAVQSLTEGPVQQHGGRTRTVARLTPVAMSLNCQFLVWQQQPGRVLQERQLTCTASSETRSPISTAGVYAVASLAARKGGPAAVTTW